MVYFVVELGQIMWEENCMFLSDNEFQNSSCNFNLFFMQKSNRKKDRKNTNERERCK